jgi:hypothetical protein
MTSLETYLRYGDVFGNASALDEFRALLKTLDLRLVLRVFAAINVICSRRGLPEQRSTQLKLIGELFEPRLAERIARTDLDVFHRRQCLYVLREAMRFCPDVPDVQATPELLHKIGLMGLMANDHASAKTPWGLTEIDALLALICDFVPVSEANEMKFDFASVARVHKVINDLAPGRANDSGYFDVAVLFENATGLRLRVFEALMLAIIPRILKSALDLVMRSTDYGVHLGFFQQTSLELPQRDAFFALLSRTAEQFRARIAGTDPLLGNFTLIRDTPFLAGPDRLVPLDTTSCMEKFETAVFWSIHNKLPDERKHNFASFWAKLFEDYIAWILQNSVDQNLNKYYSRPRYLMGNHEEVCDGIIICGTTAIFIECKGGLIRGDAKYADDPAKLASEIEKKYVKPKGVFQLARAIGSALDKDSRPEIGGVDLDGIRTVSPLLITRDDLGDGFFVNTYLNRRFADAKRETGLSSQISPVYCGPLHCISVDVIEKLSPYLCDTPFADILSQRYIADPRLGAPFFLKANTALSMKGPDRVPTLLRDINDELREIVADFVGGNKPAS